MDVLWFGERIGVRLCRLHQSSKKPDVYLKISLGLSNFSSVLKKSNRPVEGIRAFRTIPLPVSRIIFLPVFIGLLLVLFIAKIIYPDSCDEQPETFQPD